jgi:hypothetical protein
MRKALILAVALVLGSTVLGATVLREPIANAASPFMNVIIGNDTTNPVPVKEQATDGSGNLKVHEQGTANVNVTNSQITVRAGTTPRRSDTTFGTISDEETIVSTVAAGHAFVVKDLMVTAVPLSSGLTVTDALCEAKLTTPIPGGSRIFTVNAFHLEQPYFTGKSTNQAVYLVVQAGEALSLRCGANISASFRATTSGDDTLVQ